MSMNKHGLFISFYEGIDGAGKSTHIDFVRGHLQKRNICTKHARTWRVRLWAKSLLGCFSKQTMHLETEALLMFASSRASCTVIEPALAAGECVLSDRFSDASFAYQGGGRHLSIDKSTP